MGRTTMLSQVAKLVRGQRKALAENRRGYLEGLWEVHDWMEREIIREERKYTDTELDEMLER